MSRQKKWEVCLGFFGAALDAIEPARSGGLAPHWAAASDQHVDKLDESPLPLSLPPAPQQSPAVSPPAASAPFAMDGGATGDKIGGGAPEAPDRSDNQHCRTRRPPSCRIRINEATCIV